MNDLYSLILNELVERGSAHVATYPPYFICSIGCHVFNIFNKQQEIYTEAGRIPDTRLPILFVAPPGFSKTYWLEQFCRGQQAILANSAIDVDFEGSMTEAGLVGTIKFEDGEPIVVPGIAKQHQYAIIAIEEFSAITEMMQQQYSRQLDTALLGLMDSGWVYKRLAAGDVKYQTYVTIWAGTQPARFDLTSGLGRRFLFLEFIPTKFDFQLLKLARRRSKNVRYNLQRTERIRVGLGKLTRKIKRLRKVEFDPQVYSFFDSLKVIHYEEALLERILIGYNLMRDRFAETMKVRLDDISKQLVIRALKFRDSIRRGSEFSEVVMVLREHGGSMPLYALKDRLLFFGKDWSQSSQLINELIRMKAIKVRPNGIVELSKSLRKLEKPKWATGSSSP